MNLSDKPRTSISPSSAVELNTTSALANYATEAVSGIRRVLVCIPFLGSPDPVGPRASLRREVRGHDWPRGEDMLLSLPITGLTGPAIHQCANN
uniref:Uncharacterized protein n=1 Tax=Timema shepardi TaxID=629360 RepID=A0A7R9AUR1_TIMSH|nr:unnamed protein product [Timema shepardi]